MPFEPEIIKGLKSDTQRDDIKREISNEEQRINQIFDEIKDLRGEIQVIAENGAISTLLVDGNRFIIQAMVMSLLDELAKLENMPLVVFIDMLREIAAMKIRVEEEADAEMRRILAQIFGID